MAGGDFEARMEHLIASTGVGVLRAEVIVDQVYAKYQELRDDLELHGGGQHHYTRDALFDQVPRIMEYLASRMLTPEGCELKDAVAEVARMLVTGVWERAPFEFGDLKASGAAHAYDDGAEYLNEPPGVHRLSKEELRAKGDLRRLGLGHVRDEDLEEQLGALG